ncbi:Calcium-binding EF-hand-containing protein [Candidatus Sulfopaludibacter sp. SbA4]|nr:Calcium-binding EF-hand-containing protein [Candidatus Sulfopaludibacter sp. SbA4]
MLFKDSTATLLMVAGAALCAGALVALEAQQAAPAGRGGGRGGAATGVFTTVDLNNDGFVTRDELKAAFAKWLSDGDPDRTGSLTQDQLAAALNAALPQPVPPAGGGRGAAPQNQTPNPADVEKMMAALPDKAPAKPKRPRKVLVLAKAAGFVHSSIPLAAKTVDAMGTKTGAWTTTVTYDPAAISAENLKQYDLVFLDSTTGAFLDDPNDPSATDARRKALLEFVRSGKGLAGIHAAGDSYHEQRGGRSGAMTAGAGGRGGRGGAGALLASQMLAAGDKNGDQKLSRDELNTLADTWFDKLDTEKAGKVSRQDFAARFASVLPPAPAGRAGGGGGRGAQQGRDTQVGTWPDFDKMIGGFFKFHWGDPQLITVKIDDPKSPLTAMFHGQEFEIHDETYTFGMDTWSRTNLHILTSIDYDKMSDADKAKEDYPRADHDYGLSWIRREGKGRVFYEAHGHSERVYAMKPMLEHVLAGVQYALGDLKADDSPSAK